MRAWRGEVRVAAFFSFFLDQTDYSYSVNGLELLLRQWSTFFFFRSSSPKALHTVSLTNPLRKLKRTDLSVSRFMAVSRGMMVYST